MTTMPENPEIVIARERSLRLAARKALEAGLFWPPGARMLVRFGSRAYWVNRPPAIDDEAAGDE